MGFEKQKALLGPSGFDSLLDGLDGDDLAVRKFHISGHVFVPVIDGSVEEIRFFSSLLASDCLIESMVLMKFLYAGFRPFGSPL